MKRRFYNVMELEDNIVLTVNILYEHLSASRSDPETHTDGPIFRLNETLVPREDVLILLGTEKLAQFVDNAKEDLSYGPQSLVDEYPL